MDYLLIGDAEFWPTPHSRPDVELVEADGPCMLHRIIVREVNSSAGGKIFSRRDT